MRADAILDKACQLVTGDRHLQNGAMRENHENIARLQSAFLTNLLGIEVNLSGADAAALLALVKVARTQSGAFNPDDYIDLAGYAAIAGQIAAALVEENGG